MKESKTSTPLSLANSEVELEGSPRLRKRKSPPEPTACVVEGQKPVQQNPLKLVSAFIRIGSVIMKKEDVMNVDMVNDYTVRAISTRAFAPAIVRFATTEEAEAELKRIESLLINL